MHIFVYFWNCLEVTPYTVAISFSTIQTPVFIDNLVLFLCQSASVHSVYIILLKYGVEQASCPFVILFFGQMDSHMMLLSLSSQSSITSKERKKGFYDDVAPWCSSCSSSYVLHYSHGKLLVCLYTIKEKVKRTWQWKPHTWAPFFAFFWRRMESSRSTVGH